MSGTLNKVMLIGRLGGDVKIHYYDSEKCIARFSIATNEIHTNKTTGEKVTRTEWHTIVVKNKDAEICEQYLSKGDKVFIEGKIKSRQWQSEDGTVKHTTEIHATEFTFLSVKKDTNSSQKFIEPREQSRPENDLPF